MKKMNLKDEVLFNIVSISYISVSSLIEIYLSNKEANDILHKNEEPDTLSQSVIIDSLIIGLPVDSVILMKSKDNTIIINGYNEISIIYKFTCLGFALSNNRNIHKSWRGKKFSELDSLSQNNIRNYTMRSVLIEKKFDENTCIYAEDLVERYRK
ncbi:hypothetical protein [Clostridium estertheticum]|uniref:hypothetical protein n=1 Tax=Clostridium estertheticum TaxID=238834 RepID=UPI001CF312AE|nr:hypothetical protein [Clostridium estertheticum]MCB2354713.1 hypothetical protein [Clostridium estertheticum]WAG40955.1 hypothetical protein LL065_22370 [Clostridium estertheticum]